MLLGSFLCFALRFILLYLLYLGLSLAKLIEDILIVKDSVGKLILEGLSAEELADAPLDLRGA